MAPSIFNPIEAEVESERAYWIEQDRTAEFQSWLVSQVEDQEHDYSDECGCDECHAIYEELMAQDRVPTENWRWSCRDCVMNFSLEIEPEVSENLERFELVSRIDYLEHRLNDLEQWLSEVANDMLDRTSKPGSRISEKGLAL